MTAKILEFPKRNTLRCSKPDRHMGFYDECGKCAGCLQMKRAEGIFSLVSRVLMAEPEADEWALRRQAARIYDHENPWDKTREELR